MGVGWGVLGPVHDDCPPCSVCASKHMSLATLPEPLSCHSPGEAGEGDGVVRRSASFLSPGSNSMLLSEKPRSLAGPWFPVCSVWR